MTSFAVTCSNLSETDHVGRALGSLLEQGHVVALIGPLGAGKTTLVKGIAAGAGVRDLRQVNSPTFVIVNEYEGHLRSEPLPIYHIDVYRLRGSEDLDAIGFDEMCRGGVVIVEWADRVIDLLPADRLTITIEPKDEDVRVLHCSAEDTAAARDLVRKLQSLLPTAQKLPRP